MKLLVGLFASISIIGLMHNSALAADLPETMSPLPTPVIEPAKVSGWYLRGDVGYKIYKAPRASFGQRAFFKEEQDPTGFNGVGLGYRFNENFRTDITLDYEWPSRFSGEAECFLPCVGGSSVETAKLDVWTVLWNAYAELGNFNGLTPYVGAGVGGSYVRSRGVRYVNADGNRGHYKGAGKWNLSWALMAGAGYELSPKWTLDAGYRYLNIGDGRTKKITAGETARIEYKDLQAHEFRVGLRYSFNETSQNYASQPLVTTY
ncbi:outer membrane protein [Flexibacterium corallicola]|uniref:outer membrane protein n=1 Tax=Flexibacterium corallicola TaxID=3037259 RepID=UPI00286EF22D|nr:porin family protein [Pseudovibrio sp. M1P-2-3]